MLSIFLWKVVLLQPGTLHCGPSGGGGPTTQFSIIRGKIGEVRERNIGDRFL